MGGMFEDVMEALQAAEESGAPSGPEYIALMDAVATECIRRRAAYRERILATVRAELTHHMQNAGDPLALVIVRLTDDEIWKATQLSGVADRDDLTTEELDLVILALRRGLQAIARNRAEWGP